MPTNPAQFVFLIHWLRFACLLIAVTAYYAYGGVKQALKMTRAASRVLQQPQGTLTNTVGVLLQTVFALWG